MFVPYTVYNWHDLFIHLHADMIWLKTYFVQKWQLRHHLAMLMEYFNLLLQTCRYESRHGLGVLKTNPSKSTPLSGRQEKLYAWMDQKMDEGKFQWESTKAFDRLSAKHLSLLWNRTHERGKTPRRCELYDPGSQVDLAIRGRWCDWCSVWQAVEPNEHGISGWSFMLFFHINISVIIRSQNFS